MAFSRTAPNLNQRLVAEILPLLEANNIGALIDIYMEPHDRFEISRIEMPLNHDGDTALTWAILHQNEELASALLERGANINAPRQNNSGLTPLILASSNNLPDMVNYLLNNGADPNLGNNEGKMPLHIAIENNNIDMVRALLEHGADPDSVNPEGKMPLYMAVEQNNIDIVRELLEYDDVDPNIPISNGNTPLHTAVNLHLLDIVRELLEYDDVDPELENQFNETPLEIATKIKKDAEDENDNALVDTMDQIIDLLNNSSSVHSPGTHRGSSSDVSELSSINREYDSDVSLPDNNIFAALDERGSNESSSIESPPSLARSRGGGTRRKRRVKSRRVKTRRVYRKKTVGKRMRCKKNKTKRKRCSKK